MKYAHGFFHFSSCGHIYVSLGLGELIASTISDSRNDRQCNYIFCRLYFLCHLKTSQYINGESQFPASNGRVNVMSPGDGKIAWQYTLDKRHHSTVSLQCHRQEARCPVIHRMSTAQSNNQIWSNDYHPLLCFSYILKENWVIDLAIYTMVVLLDFALLFNISENSEIVKTKWLLASQKLMPGGTKPLLEPILTSIH